MFLFGLQMCFSQGLTEDLGSHPAIFLSFLAIVDCLHSIVRQRSIWVNASLLELLVDVAEGGLQRFESLEVFIEMEVFAYLFLCEVHDTSHWQGIAYCCYKKIRSLSFWVDE